MCSMPTERRMKAGLMPMASSSSGVDWLWVVEAGCTARERTSPMLTSREWRVRESTNFWAVAASASLRVKPRTAPAPLGRYFWASW